MHHQQSERAQGRPVWMFMAATAMATTVSTMAATAMVQAEATEPVAVTCACEAPAAAAPPAQAEAPTCAPAQAEAPEQAEAPRRAAESNALDEMSDHAIEPAVADPAPKAEVDGALDKDIIRRIVKAHIGEVRYCYNEGLASDPELSGRVVVEFVIGPKGKVTRSSAESDMEGDVPACIAKAVEGWLFPRPGDGNDVSVTYPFVLEPG